jgi:cobalt/nickel transport system permease protein
MHIPDNFLSTPVWAALDAISIPAVGLLARRASKDLEESRVPLLGVMGAFVFAAQMINFPVGIGTSGHLVGGALLACTLGTAPAVVVMTAILAVQALVFQDGGVLALGANIFNMALAGVLAGALPYQLWGAGRWRRTAVFAGAFLSVLVSGSLAVAELLVSGVRMPRAVVLISLALFAVSAALEGAITVAVLSGIERMKPAWTRDARSSGGATPVLAACAIVLAAVGFLIASQDPDGLQRLGAQLGLAAKSAFQAPLADYTAPFMAAAWVRRACAGLAGLALVYAACATLAKVITRQRSA